MARDSAHPGKEAGGGLLAGLTPNVIRLGLVSFFADVASEMLYPLIPVFLTAVLGAPVAVVGLIEGSAEATASILKSVSGVISDRTRKRIPWIFGGYSLSAVSKPFMALATGWPLVLVARVADRTGKGLRTSPRDALLADSTAADTRGRAFGWHRAMDTMGAVVGPLLALALITLLGGGTGPNLRLILLLAFIPGAIGALLVLTVKESAKGKEAAKPASSSAEAGVAGLLAGDSVNTQAATLEGSGRLEPARSPATPAAEPFALRDLPSPYRKYLLAWGIFALTNSSDVFLILKARDLGFGVAGVTGLYCLYNLVYAAGSPLFGHRSDTVGRPRVLMAGLAVFAVVYMGFAMATKGWMLWGLFAVYGLYIAATEGVGKAAAVDLVPSHLRGTAVGVLGTVSGVATLAASTVAGILWSVVGPSAAFAFGASGAVVAIALLLVLRPFSVADVLPG
jgi:MFS family permease